MPHIAPVTAFPILLERAHRRTDDRAPDHDLYAGTYVQGETPDQDHVRCGRRLKGGPADDVGATWTPAGDLAYIELDGRADDAGALYVKARGSGPPARVLGAAVRSVAYAPAGDRMAFVAYAEDRDRFRLWIARADGSQARPVHLGTLEPEAVTWAPDGRTLAFSCMGDVFTPDDVSEQTNGLRLLDLGTGHVRRLTDGVDWAPRFSPDGRTLVFEHHEGSHDALAILDVATGQARSLQASLEDRYLNPAFTPDGSRILYARESRSSHDALPELWVMPSTGGPGHALGVEGVDRVGMPAAPAPAAPAGKTPVPGGLRGHPAPQPSPREGASGA